MKLFLQDMQIEGHSPSYLQSGYSILSSMCLGRRSCSKPRGPHSCRSMIVLEPNTMHAAQLSHVGKATLKTVLGCMEAVGSSRI